MQTKPLLYGLLGFFIGGFIVAVAATTFDKPSVPSNEMSMSDMVASLDGKVGDDFDKAFISAMVEHHKGAIDMAAHAQKNAKHNEIKEMANSIVLAQSREIDMMKMWQVEWGYENTPAGQHTSAH